MAAPESSLWDHYTATVAADPDRWAVADQQGRRLTHRELQELAGRASAGFAASGLGPGSIIGVFLPNRVSWPVLALAAAHSGIGVLGLNTRFRRAELNHLLGVAEIDVVVVADQFLGIDGPTLFDRLDRPVQVIVDPGDDGIGPADDAMTASTELLSDLLSDRPGEAVGAGEHPLIGFTTSGTTGLPKIAMHTQRQTHHHLVAVIDRFGLGADTVTLAPLPLCGAFGYTAAMATLLAGGAVAAHETWSADAAAAAIDEEGVTFFNASDDMLLGLASSDRFRVDTTWTLGGFADFTNAGAEAVATIEEITAGATRLAGLYGSSEGFALMSTWDRRAPQSERVRNGGFLVSPDMAVRCCDPESGARLRNGEPGELQFRGPNLITGYLNNPDADQRAFTDDGWYRSGDLGQTVEPDGDGHQGFIYLARLGDTLRLRGFLCDPAEIEHHLELHRRVELAQVVGVRRPGVGDVAVGFVLLSDCNQDAKPVNEADLLAHCHQGLANYKRPERIIFVEDFPVTDGPNGTKIRKVDLRERAARLLGVGTER